ncbi:hypothetical protein [Streptomyces sp. NPDC002172]
MAPPPGSGTASANPALLTAYSDACTHGAQELQNWIRAVLAPALERYLTGATARQDGVNVDIAAVNRLVGVVQDRLPRHIASVYYTDRDVRRVARLFEEAGTSGGPLLPGVPLGPLPTPGTPAPNHIVHTTDGTLDRLDTQDGALLARRLDVAMNLGGPVLKTYMSQLAQYADDPLFCAGYYNALTRAQLEHLPWSATTAQALATAFASGQLSRGAQVDIAYVLIDRDNGGEVPTAVLAGLAANPQGAANFTRYLLSDRKALKVFLRGRGWGEGYPGFTSNQQQAAFMRGLLRVFASAESTMTPDEVRSLVGVVAENLPKGLDVKVAQAVQEDLRRFLVVSTARLLPKPPAPEPGVPYQVTLNSWAEKYGMAMHGLVPYVTWLQGIYQDNQKANAELHNWIENIALGAVGVVLTGGATAPALVYAANGLYGGAAGEIQGHLDHLLGLGTGPKGPLNMENELHKGAILAMVVAVYGRGLGDRSLPDILRDTGLGHLLSSVEQGHWPDPVSDKWATAQKLRMGHGGTRLQMLLDALQSHFK